MRNDDEEERPKYINPLLDIDQYSGEPRKRLAPLMTFLFVSGIPLLLWVYWFMRIIPFWLIIIVEIIWATRWGMIILGEEGKRVAQYKKQIYDVYSSSYELLGIKTIHPDGLIEYTNGEVGYMIIADNGNREDDILRAQAIMRLIESLGDHFVPDIYIQNISVGDVLAERYSNVKMFADRDVMRDIITLIDYNIKSADEESFLTRTIFLVKCRKSQFKELRENIEVDITSRDAKAFKCMKLADSDIVQKMISRDLGTYIDYLDLIMRKYATGDYDGSHVTYYDKHELSEEDFYKIKDSDEEVGFIDTEG